VTLICCLESLKINRLEMDKHIQHDGGRSGYNKVRLSQSKLGLDLLTDVYIYVLVNNRKIIGKGKMAVMP
jgi:hypothetical protein